MFPALLSSILYSISAVAASRFTRLVGGIEANFLRIVLATLLLGVYGHSFGAGFTGKALPFFLLSGVIGFGIGDIALYQAFPRIGSRLCMMLVHCLAAPVGAFIEWLWLGTTLSLFQVSCSVVVLLGVAVALAPSEHLHIPRNALIAGVIFGLIAAFGQAGGAVVSRKAYDVTREAGQSIDGISAAYQRIWGGVAIAAITYVGFRLRARPEPRSFRVRMRPAWKWLLLNGAVGPALGVSCFQWALSTTPTGIVLSVVALTPLIIIPFSFRFENEKPTARSLIGGVIAVLGVIGLRISLG
jgi:drug/metabolite transporter (DMT)-like permease